MTVRKQILIAIANGCVNTRQIADKLNKRLGHINAYFYRYKTVRPIVPFVNGDLVKRIEGKNNTLLPGPNLAIIRGPDGAVKDVGRAELYK